MWASWGHLVGQGAESPGGSCGSRGSAGGTQRWPLQPTPIKPDLIMCSPRKGAEEPTAQKKQATRSGREDLIQEIEQGMKNHYLQGDSENMTSR